MSVIDRNTQNCIYDEKWILNEFERSLMTDKFHIYLQPQVDMEGHILGAEVLTRWIDHDDVLVPVSQFIPILAKTDLIAKLDEHVWELAAQQISLWKGTDLEKLHLSVNVEPKDFMYLNVPNKLKALCDRYNIDIKKLHVEITERGFESDIKSSEEIIQELHKNGITVEIDDFGKGSSSLSILKDLYVDVLKLDMDFIKDTGNVLRSKIILESVVGMANKLHTEVIIEGVETKTQKERIENVGCKIYQGFLFSKPIPVPQFEELYYASLIGKEIL